MKLKTPSEKSSTFSDLPYYYPGYVIRVYHNAGAHERPDSHALLCELFCARSDVLDLCDVTRLPGLSADAFNASQYGDNGGLVDVSGHLGLVWRYLPMADPLVKEWHARDLDSRLGEKRRCVACRNF